MKKIILVLIAALLTQVGCKKDEIPETETPIDQVKMNPVGAVLKSVVWKTNNPIYDVYENYSYNADGTLNQTLLGNTQTVHAKAFNYDKGLLKQVVKADKIIYKYEYNIIKQLIGISILPYAGANYGSKLEFEYNANGTLKALNYIQFDNSGSGTRKIIYSTTYTYDSQNLVQKITSISYPNLYRYEYVLENYSSECQFSAWPFLTDVIREDFQFYNISLLSRLNKLPKKITRTTYNSNGQSIDVKVQNIDYDIVNKQLEKIVYDNFEMDFQY